MTFPLFTPITPKTKVSKRKWQQGKRALHFLDLEDPKTMIWDTRAGKVYTAGWVSNWQYRVIVSLIRRKVLYIAEKTEYGKMVERWKKQG